MDQDQLLTEAEAIGEQLLKSRRAIGTAVTWAGPVGYGTELSPLAITQLGPHLYDGTTGVALFLAALARSTMRDEYRATCLQAIAPLRRKLIELAEDPERAGRLGLAVGGLLGIGSFVYGLAKIGDLLGEPELLEEAHRATALITEERIARDRQTRIQTGCAGAILALLALHARIPGPNPAGVTPLALAMACGRHLLRERVSWNGWPAAWALSPGMPPLAGFSYGAGGISYALLRLSEASGDEAFRKAASEGLAFVDRLYVAEQRSWRDSRVIFQRAYHLRRGTWKDWWLAGTLDDLEARAPTSDSTAVPCGVEPVTEGEDRFLDIWCHGASGIVLGRIGALPLDDRLEIPVEIGQVLTRICDEALTQELDPADLDDLCCGHMGRIEMLLYAGRRLGDASCAEVAHQLMDRVCRRAHDRGRFELSASRGSGLFAPALFQGISGVGYTLLRLALPQDIPCLLLFE